MRMRAREKERDRKYVCGKRRRVAPVRTSPVMAAATPALREDVCV